MFVHRLVRLAADELVIWSLEADTVQSCRTGSQQLSSRILGGPLVMRTTGSGNVCLGPGPRPVRAKNAGRVVAFPAPMIMHASHSATKLVISLSRWEDPRGGGDWLERIVTVSFPPSLVASHLVILI